MADVIARAAESVGRLTDWFKTAALPLWIDQGYDPASGAFWEHLDFEAQPIRGTPRRLTVQGRQIFTYARAIELGWWTEGRDKVERAFEAMIARYGSPDGAPGYVFKVSDSGEVIDPTRDFYAHAFVILAASALYRLTGDGQFIAVADEALAFLDETLTSPTGGYLDSWPKPPHRLRQNPHMHLFEALLALHAATGKAAYLARAGEIFGYFRTRFFRPEMDILAEFFDLEWTPEGGSHVIWEPGHHLEWSWLLAEYQRATGTPTGRFADRLVARAYREGVLSPCLIVEEMRGDGTILKKGCRAWPLTEAIKAQAVRLEAGDPEAGERLIAATDWLVEEHLLGCMSGLWHDQFTHDRKLVPNYVPASTLYHIAMAVFVADEVMGRLTK